MVAAGVGDPDRGYVYAQVVKARLGIEAECGEAWTHRGGAAGARRLGQGRSRRGHGSASSQPVAWRGMTAEAGGRGGKQSRSDGATSRQFPADTESFVKEGLAGLQDGEEDGGVAGAGDRGQWHSARRDGEDEGRAERLALRHGFSEAWRAVDTGLVCGRGRCGVETRSSW